MGEKTKLVKAAPNVSSLRTTVPMSIVRQFALSEGDSIDWEFDIKNDKIVLLVRPIKDEKSSLKERKA